MYNTFENTLYYNNKWGKENQTYELCDNKIILYSCGYIKS